MSDNEVYNDDILNEDNEDEEVSGDEGLSENEEVNSDDNEEVSEEEGLSENEEVNSDDNEEVLGDDEGLSENEEEEEEEVNNDDIEEEVLEENAINIENNEQRRVPIQETLFKGVNPIGMRIHLNYKNHIHAIDLLLSFIAQAVRHNATYEQLLDNLKCLKDFFTRINLPISKKKLWKILGRTKENLIYRYFCSKCKQEIGQGSIRIRCRCGRCGPGQEKSFVATFIQILLRPQLCDLFRIPNMSQKLQYKHSRIKINPEAIEDIYDGNKYKELSQPGNFLSNPNNFSLTLWTDGLKVTKSSRATTYPVVLHLNELSPHARKKHFLLAGIWVSDEHPVMSSILRPIVNEIRDLHNVGIAWKPNGEEEIVSKFIVTIFTADSVTKPDALRMKKFNGENGCPACFATGQMEEHTWIYPAVPHVMRTDATIRRDGLMAIESGAPVNGVKGLTALALMPEFDLVCGVVVDASHNAFLGVAKRLVVRYLTDAEESWYIGHPNDTSVIDSRLLSIKPPTRISRRPRSILLYRMWKASEWRNWLLYYCLPCLHEILQQPYYNHLSLLCKAVFILNSSSITNDQLDTAENLINQFVVDYERLYGLKNMVFNVHLLKHCPLSVRNWGPLWVYSALPFESLNKKITDYITSPHGRADQIVSRFFMKKFVIVAAMQLPISEEVKRQLYRLLSIEEEHPPNMHEGHYFRGMAVKKIRFPDAEEINLLREAGQTINRRIEITFFKSAMIHGSEYRAKDAIDRKFSNFIAFSEESTFYLIEKLLEYTHEGVTVSGIIGKRYAISGNAYRTPHIQRIVTTEEKEFVMYESIISQGFFLPHGNEVAAVSLSNLWETD